MQTNNEKYWKNVISNIFNKGYILQLLGKGKCQRFEYKYQ